MSQSLPVPNALVIALPYFCAIKLALPAACSNAPAATLIVLVWSISHFEVSEKAGIAEAFSSYAFDPVVRSFKSPSMSPPAIRFKLRWA